MSRVLLVYASKYGQTQKIAEVMASTLRELGHSVELLNTASEKALTVTSADVDALLVGAPVYAGNFPKSMRVWARGNQELLRAKPSAFFSVCLGVLEKENAQAQADERKFVETFTTALGWKPMMTRVLAGGLPYTKYWLPIRWMMRRISRKAGGDTDTHRDYEYTDWVEVRQFARDFVAGVSAEDRSAARASTGQVAS
jgi:menaquinone-dependent protoporphyrinogen oxidase